MGKIAIVSCYFMKNYGSVLQAYATQKIVTKLGFENETICIDGIKKEIRNRKLRYFFSKILDFDVVRNKYTFLKHHIYRSINIDNFNNKMKLRDGAFNDFIKNFSLSDNYDSFDKLEQSCSNYSTVLVGSDQLWLPSNIIADYYTLNWVPDEINKVSYATSFGVSSLENKIQRLAEVFLKRINHLSVREISGRDLIKEICGLESQVVCDPTLLFTADEWMEIQPKDNRIKEKYIFCYFIGNNSEHRNFAKQLKMKTGYKIIALQHIDEYIKEDEGFADEAPYDIGPGDFISLIRNAEYICTDSFHGMVFSILNEKKFFIFRRFKEGRRVSTNSRIDSLLDLLNLRDRLLSGYEDINKCIDKNIDYDLVNKKLILLRDESKKYLRDSLI